MEVAYVRTPEGYEVDFLARARVGGEELIQVCAEITDSSVFEREYRALADAAMVHPRAQQRLLVANFDALPAKAPKGVIVQPAWEWLLDTAGRT